MNVFACVFASASFCVDLLFHSIFVCFFVCLFCFVFFFEIPIVVTFRFCGIDFPKFFWLRFVITFHNKRSFSSSSLRRTLELGQVRAIFRVSFVCLHLCLPNAKRQFSFLSLSLLFGLSLVLLLLFCFSYTILFSAHAVRDLNVFGSVKFGFLLAPYFARFLRSLFVYGIISCLFS